MLAGVVCAQHSVDPKNLYHRIVCVTPLTGSGTATDPVRPKYAPWPLPVPEVGTPAPTPAMQTQGGITAFSYVAESNNKLDKCLSRAYSKLDDQVHAGAVRFAAGKAMAEGVRHLE